MPQIEPDQWLLELYAQQKQQVKHLGHAIGYGNLMHLAQECWHEKDKIGSFVVGPCAATTVPCGCEGPCDWCCGSGWVTKRVKSAKDS